MFRLLRVNGHQKLKKVQSKKKQIQSTQIEKCILKKLNNGTTLNHCFHQPFVVGKVPGDIHKRLGLAPTNRELTHMSTKMGHLTIEGYGPKHTKIGESMREWVRVGAETLPTHLTQKRHMKQVSASVSPRFCVEFGFKHLKLRTFLKPTAPQIRS